VIYNKEVNLVSGSNIQIDLTAFADGAYVLRAISSKSVYNQTIIKQ
jgi:hypothetical protein